MAVLRDPKLKRKVERLGDPRVKKATERVVGVLREAMMSLAVGKAIGPVRITRPVAVSQMTKSFAKLKRLATMGIIKESPPTVQYFKQIKDLIATPSKAITKLKRIRFVSKESLGTNYGRYYPGPQVIDISTAFRPRQREVPHEIIHNIQFTAETESANPLEYRELFMLSSLMENALATKGYSPKRVEALMNKWSKDKRADPSFPINPIERQAYNFERELSKENPAESFRSAEMETLRNAIVEGRTNLERIRMGDFP